MILIIPDIHLDALFAEKILRRHSRSTVRRLILLGDYFDARDKNPTAICATLNRLVAEYGEAFTPLIGNHEIPYWQCFREGRILENPDFETPQYTLHDAGIILKNLGAEVWNRMQFLHTEGEVIFTHAGLNSVNYERWRTNAAFRTKMRRLAHPLESAFLKKTPEVFAVSRLRGGREPLGGLIWQDWMEWTKTTAALPIPGAPWQVFGHTRGRARTHGNAVCLDGEQTLYATWDETGFIVRHAATGAGVLTVAGFPSPANQALKRIRPSK